MAYLATLSMRRANRLAYHLRNKGVKPDDLVAVHVDRGIQMIVAMLGIIKAGAAYVPLDRTNPVDRLRYIVGDSGVKILVTDDPDSSATAQLPVQVVDLNTVSLTIGPHSGQDLAVLNQDSDLVYVIYTSGSTGNPKGVMIEHRNLMNNVNWQIDTFGFNAADRFLQRTTIVFDAAMWELWTPLVVGATIVVADDEQVKDPHETLQLIRAQKVSFAQTVPSFLSAILRELERDPQVLPLRLFAVGGEALPVRDARRWAAVCSAELVNCYGPTETTVDATYFRCSDHPIEDVMPIGRPVANSQIYLCDEYLQQAAPGESGEICIGGLSVARGYLNRTELTREKFVPDPFGERENGRLYRTGDLGRLMPDGNLEFLGRIDTQVKIRGHRIELGEIEAGLSGHLAVAACVVNPVINEVQEALLVAYVVKTNANTTFELTDMQQHLRQHLPDYMVPQRLVHLDALPLLPNEKVDRNALAAPLNRQPEVDAAFPDCNDTERELLKIWHRNLGVSGIGLDDSFFDVGGDSLLALGLLAEIDDKFKRTLRLAAMFDAPTVRKMARLLVDGSGPSGCAVPIKHQENRPPLFYVPGWGGAIVRLAKLAQLLPQDRPFYVLDTSYFGRKPDEQLVLEEVASQMIRAMREIQQSGPYHLCGYSLGGKFVYEIAQQLRAMDQEVALLALLDTPAPGYPRSRPALGRILMHMRLLMKKSMSQKARYFYERAHHVLRKSKGIEFELFDGDADIAKSAPARAIQASADAAMAAWEAYEPSYYAGSLVQIAAQIREERPSLVDDDPEQGWGPLIGGGIKVRQINCKHLNMADPENADQLAKVLSEFLVAPEPATRPTPTPGMHEKAPSKRPSRMHYTKPTLAKSKLFSLGNMLANSVLLTPNQAPKVAAI